MRTYLQQPYFRPTVPVNIFQTPEPSMELEYKILQSQTPFFANAAKMHEAVEQESKAGWTLLEKEDNYRIKLKRNTSNRDNDKNLDFDAYRSTVGVSSVVTYGITVALTLGVVSVILYLAIWNS
jgi:hypothetical protein